MLRDHLLRTDLRRHVERDGVLKPRCAHHARLLLFYVSEGARHDEAHAVDEPHLKLRRIIHFYGDGLFGDKLRLGRHDGSARGGLRQLVDGTVARGLIFDVRDDRRIHKFLDEGRFARAHWTDDADVNFAVRARLHIFIYAECFHSHILSAVLFSADDHGAVFAQNVFHTVVMRADGADAGVVAFCDVPDLFAA